MVVTEFNPIVSQSHSSKQKNAEQDINKTEKRSTNIAWCLQTVARASTEYRLQLNVMKTLIEVVPSLLSIQQLAANLNGACVNGKTNTCVDNTWENGACMCMPKHQLCSGGDSSEVYPESYCDSRAVLNVSYANPCSYDATVKMVTEIQLAVSTVSCMVELAMLLTTVYKFKHTHQRMVYIVLNLAIIVLQVGYCLVLALYAVEFGFTIETTVLVIFSKLVAIALGTGHLAYLIPYGKPQYRDCVLCLKYGLAEESM